MIPPSPQAAAQYFRVSTDSQRSSSLDQRTVIAEYAQAHDLTVVATFEDAGKSGVTTKGRAGLSALLSEVIGGAAPYKTVLVLDVSRWGRYQDPDEAGHYEFVCRAAGVDIRYCAEAFETGPAGSIVKQLKRVMAGEYSRELSAKVRQAKLTIQSLGLKWGPRERR